MQRSDSGIEKNEWNSRPLTLAPNPNHSSGNTVHRTSNGRPAPARASRLASRSSFAVYRCRMSVDGTSYGCRIVNRMNAPGLAATSIECQLPKASRATAMHEARVLQVLHRGPSTDTHHTRVCGRNLLRARLLTRRRLLGAGLDHDRRKHRTRRKRHRSGERQE